MDAGIGTRPTTALIAAAIALVIGVLAALAQPLTAIAAAPDQESTAETETAVLEQVDPLAAGLALAALLVALALVFLLARRLFKTS
jgi:mannose/fructose/N-acetylgalactosamine-specific phosphotransferase system component IID